MRDNGWNKRAEAKKIPLWRGTALRASAWGEIGAREFEKWEIRFGIRYMPSVLFRDGLMMGELTKSEREKWFGREDLRSGCVKGVYEEVDRGKVRKIFREGKMVSSAFVAWKGEGKDEKGRMVVNFHFQSQQWPRRSVRMETVAGFAGKMEKGDKLMSWDVKAGYRHFYLHPEMSEYFVFPTKEGTTGELRFTLGGEGLFYGLRG